MVACCHWVHHCVDFIFGFRDFDPVHRRDHDHFVGHLHPLFDCLRDPVHGLQSKHM